MTYTVEHGIPIPPKKGGNKVHQGSLTDTLMNLPVGGSIFLAEKTTNSATSAASNARKRLESTGVVAKFTTRAVVENDVAGARIWREAAE